MADPIAFESRTAQIDNGIDAEVARVRTRAPLTLPDRASPITKGYVQKIEGTYNVSRAKTDTDNAIDLLYIAYNTTPQEEGEARVRIARIMDKLIAAQGDSERAMAEAMRAADHVISALSNALPDWLDAKDDANPAEAVKAFAGKDLLEVATNIKTQATTIRTRLLGISQSYDNIIRETAAASETSEKALGERIGRDEAITKEINEANADREQLEALVKDLKEEVQKFDKRAREYEARAETSEKRAFILQIVKIGAQVLAAAMPAIAMAAGAAATGGASVIAASALSTAGQAAAGKAEATPKADTTAETIKTKAEIAQTKKDLVLAEKKKTASKDKVEKLRTELKKAQEDKKQKGDANTVKEDVEQPEDAEAVKGIKGRLKDAKTELKEDEDKASALDRTLASLQASLSALAQGLGELSKEQKDEAASLREIQMKMLDKAEAYEKERREQSAKLVRITALLTGQLSQRETIKLAIKSLNMSITALKRTKEIVEEIAFFFKSFTDFMDQVSQEAKIEIDLVNTTTARSTLGKNAFENLVRSTDGFFIRQAGEWRAIHAVSDTFNRSFADGRTKLNSLSGKYITGEDLTAYLKGASILLEKIVKERDESAKARLLDLEQYRKMLREETAPAVKTEVA